jgi:hypothetical protein
VAINVLWLVMAIVSPKPPIRSDEAYAECRAALRKLRPEAARIPFPTGDLVRVTRRDSVRHEVRGYYVVPPGTRHTRYTCEVRVLPGSGAWKIDSISVAP